VQTPVRVLYVDDSPFDRALVRDALEQEDGSFQVIEAASRAEFFARLVEGGYDLVLSDFNILGFEGLQVIDAVQTQEPGIPVVIVTGTGSEEIAVAALKRGAADYVIKTPQHIQRLPLTIQAVLERTRLEAERLRQDRQLRYQAEQITQIMRSVPDGVLLLNSENRILLANPTAQAMLVQLGGAQPGDTLTELAGRPLAELLTSPPRGEWHELNQEGRTYEVIARPLLTSGPVPGGWVLLLRDVTEQRMVQRQYRSQERLAAVGQLAAGIAHDFNNLMGVIVLYVELLARAPDLAPHHQARLAIISQQAEQAAQLIRQILDFSRRSVLEPQPLNLHHLLRDEIRLLRRLLPEHIEVTFDSVEDECLVSADATRLRQIVLNLAVNARDAMPQGGRLTLALARVTVGSGRERPVRGMRPGEWVRLTVTDTGFGIPAENLERIFEPFFTTKPPGAGSGLGLAQVHGIVAQHGGQITVASQLGAGTSFTIYLPALATGEPDAASPPPPAVAEGNGELILVVEDSQPLRAALASFLQGWRYRTLEAANGAEALAQMAASAEPVALVLSDAVMPTMGGGALLHTLRSRGVQTPLILLTGHPLDEADLQSLREQGLYSWLIKPPDLMLLAQTIHAALAKSAPA
jgi:two-component system cell cycle sensor histidine kinase/response regulator CckA